MKREINNSNDSFTQKTIHNKLCGMFLNLSSSLNLRLIVFIGFVSICHSTTILSKKYNTTQLNNIGILERSLELEPLNTKFLITRWWDKYWVPPFPSIEPYHYNNINKKTHRCSKLLYVPDNIDRSTWFDHQELTDEHNKKYITVVNPKSYINMLNNC